jgi:hypothetical protein
MTFFCPTGILPTYHPFRRLAMTRAGTSMFVFSFWVFACGIGLMFFPGLSLSVLEITMSSFIPVRLFGMILIFLGIYYVVTARHPACWPFYRVTVYTRASALVIVIIFVFIGWADPLVVGFVIIDALGALWTFLALRRDAVEGSLA